MFDLISRLLLSWPSGQDFEHCDMPATDGSKLLLGYDNELATQRWEEEDIKTRENNYRRLRSLLLLLATLLLVALTTFFVLSSQWLYWPSAYDVPALNITTPHPSMPAEPSRDFKWSLHPEDHVSRDAGNRHFSWNITKAEIVPGQRIPL